jgi:hypothetical protein
MIFWEFAMNRQQIFDTVKNHLLAQGERCVGVNDSCAYRSGSMRCAVGVLIPDEYYTSEMEGITASTIGCSRNGQGVYDYNVPEWFRDNADFLEELQKLHDDEPVESWERKLRELAGSYKLKWE